MRTQSLSLTDMQRLERREYYAGEREQQAADEGRVAFRKVSEPTPDRESERRGRDRDSGDDDQRDRHRNADVEDRESDPEGVEADGQRCEQQPAPRREVEPLRAAQNRSALAHHVHAQAEE